MRPDFKHTATGYVWLDKLTLPFWWVYDKWHEWRFFRFLGKGDAERGREIMRRAVAAEDAARRFDLSMLDEQTVYPHAYPLTTEAEESVRFEERWK